MFLFMGIIYKEIDVFLFGLSLVVVSIWLIRTQFLISTAQYKLGMIPHHSMAVHISKKLLSKKSDTDDRTNRLVESIIKRKKPILKFLHLFTFQTPSVYIC